MLATLKGSAFERMTAQHPLLENVESVVLNGDHVTLDAGYRLRPHRPGLRRRRLFHLPEL